MDGQKKPFCPDIAGQAIFPLLSGFRISFLYVFLLFGKKPAGRLPHSKIILFFCQENSALNCNASVSCAPTPSPHAHGSRAGCSPIAFQHAAQAPALRGGDTFHREKQEPIKFSAVRTIRAFVSSPVKQSPLKREEGAGRPRTLPSA